MVWFLVVFSFNVNYMNLEHIQFSSKEACLKAKQVIESSSAAIANAPAAQTLRANCIEDSFPVK